tara:strand:+ start:2791 stop:3990 length:1200 start_codon:yes stop_codon:yes gene_type:complete
MKTSVIGLGYVGLPTAAVLSDSGHDVLGVDINKAVVSSVNQGKIHIFEPNLEEMVNKSVANGKLRASMVPEKSDNYLIVVPTPLDDLNEPDLSFINQVVYSISPYLQEGCLIILESTSPIGTTVKVLEKIRNYRPDLFDVNTPKFFAAYCPERVLPGNVIEELIFNDRIVGGINQRSTQRAIEFYKTFVKGQVFATNSKTAELAKLVENSYRDLNIAFANELSMICDEIDVDVWELISLANRHPRVNILSPGAGVGGHCIAVDPWFIVSDFPEQSRIIKTAREVNNFKPEWAVKKVLSQLPNQGIVACFGMSYKQDIDDTRESPSIKIADYLVNFLGKDRVSICDPYLDSLQGHELDTIEEALNKAHLVVFCVAHEQFKKIDKKMLENKKILDLCGVLK